MMYKTSKDYELLFDEMLSGHKVACYVDYHDSRDLAEARIELYNPVKPVAYVSVRGMSYISVFTDGTEGSSESLRGRFVKQCEAYRLEWIMR